MREKKIDWKTVNSNDIKLLYYNKFITSRTSMLTNPGILRVKR